MLRISLLCSFLGLGCGGGDSGGPSGDPDAALPAGDGGGGGLACGYQEDDGNDGLIDVFWHFTYDDQDRLVLEEGDHDDGGSRVDQRWVREYHSSGEVTLEEWYHGQALLQRERYSYDRDGNMLSENHDADGDGIDEERTTHQIEAGRRVLSEVDDQTADGEAKVDGIVDLRRTYTYDGELLAAISFDSDLDGEPNFVHTYRYAGGLLIEIEARADSAPVLMFRETFEYDDRGRRVGWSRDDDDDGQFDLRETRTWDDADRLIELFNEFDPEFELPPLRTRYAYADDGRLLTIEMTGFNEQTDTYLFDCPGWR